MPGCHGLPGTAIGFIEDTDAGPGGEATCAVCRVAADGSAHTVLHALPRGWSGEYAAAAWSPAGPHIAYASETDDVPGALSIWILTVAADGGTAARQLVTHPVPWVWHWSPNGKSIAYLTGTRSRPCIVDVASGKIRELRLAGWDLDDLAWSPDGTRIALLGRTLSVIEANGSGLVKLTATEHRSSSGTLLAWRPLPR